MQQQQQAPSQRTRHRGADRVRAVARRARARRLRRAPRAELLRLRGAQREHLVVERREHVANERAQARVRRRAAAGTAGATLLLCLAPRRRRRRRYHSCGCAAAAVAADLCSGGRCQRAAATTGCGRVAEPEVARDGELAPELPAAARRDKRLVDAAAAPHRHLDRPAGRQRAALGGHIRRQRREHLSLHLVHGGGAVRAVLAAAAACRGAALAGRRAGRALQRGARRGRGAGRRCAGAARTAVAAAAAAAAAAAVAGRDDAVAALVLKVVVRLARAVGAAAAGRGAAGRGVKVGVAAIVVLVAAGVAVATAAAALVHLAVAVAAAAAPPAPARAAAPAPRPLARAPLVAPRALGEALGREQLRCARGAPAAAGAHAAAACSRRWRHRRPDLLLDEHRAVKVRRDDVALERLLLADRERHEPEAAAPHRQQRLDRGQHEVAHAVRSEQVLERADEAAAVAGAAVAVLGRCVLRCVFFGWGVERWSGEWKQRGPTGQRVGRQRVPSLALPSRCNTPDRRQLTDKRHLCQPRAKHAERRDRHERAAVAQRGAAERAEVKLLRLLLVALVVVIGAALAAGAPPLALGRRLVRVADHLEHVGAVAHDERVCMLCVCVCLGVLEEVLDGVGQAEAAERAGQAHARTKHARTKHWQHAFGAHQMRRAAAAGRGRWWSARLGVVGVVVVLEREYGCEGRSGLHALQQCRRHAAHAAACGALPARMGPPLLTATPTLTTCNPPPSNKTVACRRTSAPYTCDDRRWRAPRVAPGDCRAISSVKLASAPRTGSRRPAACSSAAWSASHSCGGAAGVWVESEGRWREVIGAVCSCCCCCGGCARAPRKTTPALCCSNAAAARRVHSPPWTLHTTINTRDAHTVTHAHLAAEPVAAALQRRLVVALLRRDLLAADVRAADAARAAHEQRALAELAGPVLLAAVLALLAEIEPARAVMLFAGCHDDWLCREVAACGSSNRALIRSLSTLPCGRYLDARRSWIYKERLMHMQGGRMRGCGARGWLF